MLYKIMVSMMEFPTTKLVLGWVAVQHAQGFFKALEGLIV